MPLPYPLRIKNEIVETVEESDDINIDSEEVALLYHELLDVQGPTRKNQNFNTDDTEDYFGEITGSSFSNTDRHEPISVRIDSRETFQTVATIAGGAGIDNTLLLGIVLVLTFGAVTQRNTERMRTDQALTYGVGWNSTDEGEVPIYRRHLIEDVVEASQDIDEVTDMSDSDVDRTIDELLHMKCIDNKNVGDGERIWFEEKFEVDYSVF